MGYRSEVILAVGPEVMPQFMVTMAKSPWAKKTKKGTTFKQEPASFIASFVSERKPTTTRFKVGDLTSTSSAVQRISTSPIARFFFAKIFLFTNTKARKAQ